VILDLHYTLSPCQFWASKGIVANYTNNFQTIGNYKIISTTLPDDNVKPEFVSNTLTRVNRAANKGQRGIGARQQQPTSTSNKVDVCNKPECKELAKYVLDTMDQSADPCKDFMQYSCGKWMKDAVPRFARRVDHIRSMEDRLAALLADSSRSSSKAIQFVKDLYKKCIDTTTINKQNSKPIHKFLQDVGGWPILLSKWDERSANLQQLFGKIFQSTRVLLSNNVLQSPFLLRLSVHTENTKQFYLDFHEHETIILAMFHRDKTHEPKIAAYKKLFTKFVSLIAGDLKLNVNNNQINMDWSKNFRLEAYGVKGEPRSSFCTKTCEFMDMATAALYIKKYFPQSEKAEAENMVTELRKEIRKGLSKLSWMDEATKKKAIEKFDMIESFIAYPDYALTDQALDRFYDKLTMKSLDAYSDMLTAVNTFNRKNTLNMLSKAPDKRLLVDPLYINGYYYRAYNFGSIASMMVDGFLALVGQRELEDDAGGPEITEYEGPETGNAYQEHIIQGYFKE
uniref:Peptidase M13 N-terminal domain-containing protein n=1 Tax=Romanomermis culicivorax TaxID=13658 RepID=A0A915JV80_ROMCU